MSICYMILLAVSVVVIILLLLMSCCWISGEISQDEEDRGIARRS
jgi:hypothetical protein